MPAAFLAIFSHKPRDLAWCSSSQFSHAPADANGSIGRSSSGILRPAWHCRHRMSDSCRVHNHLVAASAPDTGPIFRSAAEEREDGKHAAVNVRRGGEVKLLEYLGAH